MSYIFTDGQLHIIQEIHDRRGGPRAAFAKFHNIEDSCPGIETEQVEDFIIAFYNAYNDRFYVRY